MRLRKDSGDDGEDLGLRYMDENAAVMSGGGIGIDKPGVRAGVAEAEANDVAYKGAYAGRQKQKATIAVSGQDRHTEAVGTGGWR